MLYHRVKYNYVYLYITVRVVLESAWRRLLNNLFASVTIDNSINKADTFTRLFKNSISV